MKKRKTASAKKRAAATLTPKKKAAAKKPPAVAKHATKAAAKPARKPVRLAKRRRAAPNAVNGAPAHGVLSAPWPKGEPPLNASRFLDALPPMSDVKRPTAAALAKLGNRLPPRLLDFFGKVGFGRFGDGFITLMHPHELDETLAEWFGAFDPTRIPFGRTALGDILYFRDLRMTAIPLKATNAKSACEVSAIEARRQRALLLASDVVEFVEHVLGDDQALTTVLRKDLFDRALSRLGAPERDEVYAFVPPLAVGGLEEPAALERAKAREHLATLLQL